MALRKVKFLLFVHILNHFANYNLHTSGAPLFGISLWTGGTVWVRHSLWDSSLDWSKNWMKYLRAFFDEIGEKFSLTPRNNG